MTPVVALVLAIVQALPVVLAFGIVAAIVTVAGRPLAMIPTVVISPIVIAAGERSQDEHEKQKEKFFHFLAQTEIGQDEKYDDDQPDNVDDAVH